MTGGPALASKTASGTPGVKASPAPRSRVVPDDETGRPLLDVRGVTLQYKTQAHLVTATYRVGFSVLQGDRFVVLGPSGCGKSTLLKAVGGYMAPTEGEIRLKGELVSKPGPDRIMVFQEFDQLLPWKTVSRTSPFRSRRPVRYAARPPTSGRCNISRRSSSPILRTAIRTRCPAA